MFPLLSWEAGVHISAFNNVLLQLKLHRACDFFPIFLDIDKWLGVFSFTVKLVRKIMVAF
jgi:hypothetical protein